MGRAFYGLTEDNDDYWTYKNTIFDQLKDKIVKRIRGTIDNRNISTENDRVQRNGSRTKYFADCLTPSRANSQLRQIRELLVTV